MNEKYFKSLSKKLDIIIKILSIQTIGNKKGKEAIKLLNGFGFKPKDISKLLNTTQNNVNVTLSKMRKKKKGGKNAKKN
jgi:hypothetical protein